MTIQVRNSLGKVITFLAQLDAQKIAYHLDHVRESIMVIVVVPGERWEIEFFEDGRVEVERFFSQGRIEGEETLDTLFSRFGDAD